MAHAWDAADYRRNAQMQLRLGGGFLERLAFPPDARVLDVGCGDGRVTSYVAARVPDGSVLGVDPDAGMVGFARAAHPQLRFAVADVRELACADAFDAVVSFTALHWVVERHDAALAAMRRALVPGGLLAVTFPGAGNMAPLTRAAEEVMARPRWASRFAGFRFPWLFPDREGYAALVEAAGLAIERLELAPKDVSHDGPAALAGWIRTTWMPYTARLPERERPAWIREVVEAYAGSDAAPVADGRIHVPSFRIELEARRP